MRISTDFMVTKSAFNGKIENLSSRQNGNVYLMYRMNIYEFYNEHFSLKQNPVSIDSHRIAVFSEIRI